jgi:hypothetical protein
MDVLDLKNLFYFIVAIIWFVASIYKKRNKDKSSQKPAKKAKPSPVEVLDDAMRQFKQQLEQPQTTEIKQKKKKPVKTSYQSDVPEEVLAIERRKKERLKAKKEEILPEKEDAKYEGALLENLDSQYSDLQKMVIFTEIFKRPQH